MAPRLDHSLASLRSLLCDSASGTNRPDAKIVPRNAPLPQHPFSGPRVTTTPSAKLARNFALFSKNCQVLIDFAVRILQNRTPVLGGYRLATFESRVVYRVITVGTMQVTTGPSRRRTSRIPVSSDIFNDVWVYWESVSGRDASRLRDISRVKDLSPSGLFIETRARKHEGDLLNLHFLVQEGQIRAEAVVKHNSTGRGLGMKINSITTQDAPHMHRLLMRLREPPKGGRKQ